MTENDEKLVFTQKQIISTSKGHIEHRSLVKEHNTIFLTNFFWMIKIEMSMLAVQDIENASKKYIWSVTCNQDIGCRKVKAKNPRLQIK